MMSDKELNENILDDDLLQDVTGGIKDIPSFTSLKSTADKVTRLKSIDTGLCLFCRAFTSSTTSIGKQNMKTHIREAHGIG